MNELRQALEPIDHFLHRSWKQERGQKGNKNKKINWTSWGEHWSPLLTSCIAAENKSEGRGKTRTNKRNWTSWGKHWSPLLTSCIAAENKSEGRGKTRTKKEIAQVEVRNAPQWVFLALYSKTRARVEEKQRFIFFRQKNKPLVHKFEATSQNPRYPGEPFPLILRAYQNTSFALATQKIHTKLSFLVNF